MILNGYQEKNIKKAADLIKKGNVVAFPTETVYGLGANALDKKAAAKIFDIKERPHFDPLIVHIASLKGLEKVAYVPNKKIWQLINKFWPGPLTLILPKKKSISHLITAGLPTVAVRMPANIIALSLIQEAGVPVAAPSANLFGRLSPTKAEHVQKQIGKKVDLILDSGTTALGIESTILLFDKTPIILRFGSLPIEQIEKIVGKTNIITKPSKILAPGQLRSHYAPFKPLFIVDSEEEIFRFRLAYRKLAFLGFRKVKNKNKFIAWQVLSKNGDLGEAAARFFDCLHKLDASHAEIIFVQKVPEKGLGRAIMDRLRKAGKLPRHI